MPRPSPTTGRDRRKSNRSRALWQVFLNGPLTRQEVGTVVSLSLATVSNLVAALVAEGVVAEVGLEDSNGGRPRALQPGSPAPAFAPAGAVGGSPVFVQVFHCVPERLARHHP